MNSKANLGDRLVVGLRTLTPPTGVRQNRDSDFGRRSRPEGEGHKARVNPDAPADNLIYDRFQNGGSSSGRTADSDSANGGSNPSPPAKQLNPRLRVYFFAGESQMRTPGFDKIALAILDGGAARRVSAEGANQSLSSQSAHDFRVASPIGAD